MSKIRWSDSENHPFPSFSWVSKEIRQMTIFKINANWHGRSKTPATELIRAEVCTLYNKNSIKDCELFSRPGPGNLQSGWKNWVWRRLDSTLGSQSLLTTSVDRLAAPESRRVHLLVDSFLSSGFRCGRMPWNLYCWGLKLRAHSKMINIYIPHVLLPHENGRIECKTLFFDPEINFPADATTEQ